MAEATLASVGCTRIEAFKKDNTPSLGHIQRLPEAISFRNAVSNRLLFPCLQSYSHCCRPCRHSLKVNAVVGYPPSMVWWKNGNQPNMHEINSAQEFVESITKAGDKLVLVDFYSVGCRSCKALHPKICQIAAENPDIEVLKVNFYENNALCRSLNVSIMPFFHFYRGKEGRIDAFSCSLTKINKLRAAVVKHKNGNLALPAPGPVLPVPNRKDLLGLPTPALVTARSLA